jgi:membrane protease YdiL (CAAX protease family)
MKTAFDSETEKQIRRTVKLGNPWALDELTPEIVFGFGHLGMGLIAVLFAGLIGFGLGLIMVSHRSIWPVVIAHGMFDATSLALLPWVAEKLQEIQRTLGH